VTLDDLSAVAPTLWELVGTKVMPEGVTIPWAVTLHELDLVCDLIDSPIQLVHFLRRRSRLNQLGGRVASDELDWWMLYLETSLYFERGPEGRLRERYLSQTDALDAWVLSERGQRNTPAPKPHQRLDPHTRAVLDCLVSERPPGWVAAGCTLLDMSPDSRKRLHRDMRASRRRAQARGLLQRGVMEFGEGPDSMIGCFVVAPDEASTQLLDALGDWVAQRVEPSFGRALGLGYTVSSVRPYNALVVIEPSTWKLPEGGSPPT
jgi:hypothetical protein